MAAAFIDEDGHPLSAAGKRALRDLCAARLYRRLGYRLSARRLMSKRF